MISHTQRSGAEMSTGIRCPVCREMISSRENVMYAESGGKEVVFHERCAGSKTLTAADLAEILGFGVSYCVIDEIIDELGV